MILFLLRIFIAIVTLRALFGLVRFVEHLRSREPDPRIDPRPPRPPEPLVDRASAIDATFTEERTES
jgi:hypothetical protein